MGERRQPKFRIFRHTQWGHRDPSSYGPLRARDLHGPDTEGPVRHVPAVIDIIPVVGTAVDAVRVTFATGYVVRGLRKGDELRMDRRARQLKTDSRKTEITKKKEFLEEYLLDRFDRVNRLAKETYHGEKLARGRRRLIGNLVGLAVSIAAYKYAPGFDHLANGYVADAVIGFTGVGAYIEAAHVFREWDERRRIRGRAGKVTGGEYTDREFQAQIARAVDLIEMPGDRAKITGELYSTLDPIRHKKWKAFDALPQSAKDAIENNAREIETIDNLTRNLIRPSAFVSRLIRSKSIRELLEDRRQIRAEADYVYVPPQNPHDTRDNGRYVRASELTTQ